MEYKFKIILVLSLMINLANAQNNANNEVKFTKQDSLRGSITPERAWWDLKQYYLDIKVDPATKTITGSNKVVYKVLKNYQTMQIDLQEPMQITKVVQDQKELDFKRLGNVFYINLVAPQKVGDTKSIQIFYGGKPIESVNPPWKGGITWKKDNNGKDFIASSCQGLGASVWWPNKDHMYDEVDNMTISVNVPGDLMNVSNGRLIKVDQLKDGTKTFHWYVSNPINNYGVNINIGDYVKFSEKYKGEKGVLDCDYYVLKYNLAAAKAQFKEVPRMLKAFESWFGPYPFYEDSYKLVEVSYLGMEHQSSVTYGNGFKNGYKGRDLSDSGWGLKFDFIIIHESGHEWFANSITYQDIADMWIHESFTNYSENLFVEYYYGQKAGAEYVIGTRKNVVNDVPIIGQYNVNSQGSKDMYYKGGNMLHTLRQVVNDTKKWRSILRGMNKKFYHQTVTAAQIEDYMSKAVGRNLNPFFNQYLRDTRIPRLEYTYKDNTLSFRWANCVNEFDIPLKIIVNDQEQWINPKTTWQSISTSKPVQKIVVDKNFYVTQLQVSSTN
jgi:aminopeptidase N